MKNYIKTLMTGLFALTLMAGFAVNAHAQAGNTDDADITATANILEDVEVAANGNLVFGNVSPGTEKAVSNISAVSGGSATGGEQAGGFTITKGADSFVTLDFTLPQNLEFDTNNLSITFSDTDARITTVDDRTTAGDNSENFDPKVEDFNLENLTGDIESGLKGAYFSATEFFVFIGGQVEPTAEQAAGTYEGTITLTATYN